MQISLLLMEEIIKLFVIMFMGYTVVKAGLMKSSESKSVSVIMVYLVIPCVILNAFQVEYTPDVQKACFWHARQQLQYISCFCSSPQS